jgi:hypothetical protein
VEFSKLWRERWIHGEGEMKRKRERRVDERRKTGTIKPGDTQGYVLH